jgi:hypothetical protein
MGAVVMDLADGWHPERLKDEFTEKVAALIRPSARQEMSSRWWS